MKLESRTQRIVKQMKLEGRCTSVSKEGTYRLDHDVAMKFAPIKLEFEQKQRGSRTYIADIESGRANLYKSNNLLNNMYEKIVNYFSNFK